jgi:hypothetical protein
MKRVTRRLAEAWKRLDLPNSSMPRGVEAADSTVRSGRRTTRW